MKKVITTVLSIVGVLVVSLFAFLFYLTNIGPSLVGPKTEIDAICQAIQPGMTTEEIAQSRSMTLDDLGITSDAGPDMSFIGLYDESGNPVESDSAKRLQVDIEHKGGFVCICQVDTEYDVATSAGEVFCTD